VLVHDDMLVVAASCIRRTTDRLYNRRGVIGAMTGDPDQM
jgi:hypothetical protein